MNVSDAKTVDHAIQIDAVRRDVKKQRGVLVGVCVSLAALYFVSGIMLIAMLVGAQ